MTIPDPVWVRRTICWDVLAPSDVPVVTALMISAVLSSVIVGSVAVTDSVAPVVVAVPALLVKTALNLFPLSARAATNAYVPDVAPAILE